MFCWFVGLSEGLHSNYGTGFHETWIEVRSWSRKDPIKFSCGCGLRGGCRNFFSNLLLHCGIGQFLILVGMALDEINQAYSEGLRDYRFDADPNKNPDQADLNMLYSILD